MIMELPLAAMSSPGSPLMDLLSGVAPWIVGLVVLYIVIRMAVRHGTQDADRRRANGHLKDKD
ncbi:hypothetical protein AB0C04_03130 [Micromonospora sp. NPDC048909]|uniref:hypothetical protein n=1 Tax=Micromonospora sp. NPDC048909 TaxID=3155643 RepID=UPI0033FE5DCC